MYRIGETLVSKEIFSKKFVCDLKSCKGACCVEGYGGAPLEKEEVKLLEKDFIKENTQMIRKLSFTIQLSDPDDYEGGNVILLTEEGMKYVVPRKKGTIILFDSRTQHCVNKVKKGVRKSIVGWVVGPRWK